ncbi:hypothetical protein ACIBCN_05300 [Nocardia sp. NPDC051052]|uniref:hypothetical protein n=1 Tax=Nocardia sp. NPDC051052 TaxID=3364322 RepID=UPI0037A4EADE
MTRPATNSDELLPIGKAGAIDEPAADFTRLLRIFGRRALFLAALALLIGMQPLALLLALAGLGLLVVPVSRPPQPRVECAPRSMGIR